MLPWQANFVAHDLCRCPKKAIVQAQAGMRSCQHTRISTCKVYGPDSVVLLLAEEGRLYPDAFSTVFMRVGMTDDEDTRAKSASSTERNRHVSMKIMCLKFVNVLRVCSTTK